MLTHPQMLVASPVFALSLFLEVEVLDTLLLASGVDVAFGVLGGVFVPAGRGGGAGARLFVFGFLIQIAGFLVILAMAFGGVYTPENWYILCIPGFMIYLGYGMLNVIMTIF